MDRRSFIFGSSGLACLALAGCSSEPELDLPEPVQINVEPTNILPGVTVLATFSAEVLVLSRKNYSKVADDPLSWVSPTDLAVAWGTSALRRVRKAVKLSQANRRYHWSAWNSDKSIVGVSDFTRHSGNWHIVPADEEVASYLKRVKPGDVVRIIGELVILTFPNGTYYVSSLSRDDSGDGACEIIRTKSIRKI